MCETVARTGAWVGICRLDTGKGQKSQGYQASGKARKGKHDEGRLDPCSQRGEKNERVVEVVKAKPVSHDECSR